MDRHEWIYKRIIILYAYFRSRLADDPYRKFEPSQRESQIIRNFIKRLDKMKDLNSIGEDYLINYFIFQANKWYRIDSQRFGGKYSKAKVIMLNWIVGPKALTFWLERDHSYDFTLRFNTFVRSRHLDRNDLYALFKEIPSDNQQPAKKVLNNSEEQDKQLYFNKDVGLAFCFENTSLFNGSKLCRKCTHQTDCKALLKENYPQLYIDRGYGKGQVE